MAKLYIICGHGSGDPGATGSGYNEAERVRALGNTMQQVGNTIIGVGKQAFESYARYEQLVGGIETLFKESQDIVMQYAHNS